MAAVLPEQVEHASHDVECPRCGYDQRGVIATWIDACPLQGVCAECGLQFNWSYVLRPDRFAPRWCVEFTPRARGLPWASVKTLARSLWPFGFWKRMNMAYEVRWRRIFAYLILLLVPALMVYVITQATVAIMARSQMQSFLDQQPAAMTATIAQLQNSLSFPPSSLASPSVEVTTANQIQWRNRIQAQIFRCRMTLARPTTLDLPYWRAAWEAIAFPLSESSSGRLTFARSVDADGTVLTASQPYPGPIDQWAILQKGPFRGSQYGVAMIRKQMEVVMLMLVGFSILVAAFPCSLVLLPVSRKRAKVRWRHIGRVALYSAFLPVLGVTVIVISLLGTYATPSSAFGDAIPFWSLIGGVIMLALWWWAAIRNYLRIPHALLVTIVLGTLTSLVVFAALFWGIQIIGWFM